MKSMMRGGKKLKLLQSSVTGKEKHWRGPWMDVLRVGTQIPGISGSKY
jgi:hypothetical protein